MCYSCIEINIVSLQLYAPDAICIAVSTRGKMSMVVFNSDISAALYEATDNKCLIFLEYFCLLASHHRSPFTDNLRVYLQSLFLILLSDIILSENDHR